MLKTTASSMKTFGSKVALIPVFIAQRVDTDMLAFSWRVNKSIISDINTGVFHALASVMLEEHHISRFQIFSGNNFIFGAKHQ